jgi:hypothetical protein
VLLRVINQKKQGGITTVNGVGRKADPADGGGLPAQN